MKGIVSLQSARDFFKNDRFATENGIEIMSVDAGKSTVHLKLNDTHRNAVGSVMGGVMFTMADFACAVAANFDTDALLVSIDSNISFIRNCNGYELYADAECVKSGRRLSFLDVTITDESNMLIAKAHFTMCAIGN